MWDTILKHALRIGLVSSILAGLYGIGVFVSGIIKIEFLTSFFVIIRNVVLPFDFIVDIPTFFIVFGAIIYSQVAFWTFKASMMIIHFFNEQ